METVNFKTLTSSVKPQCKHPLSDYGSLIPNALVLFPKQPLLFERLLFVDLKNVFIVFKHCIATTILLSKSIAK